MVSWSHPRNITLLHHNNAIERVKMHHQRYYQYVNTTLINTPVLS